MELTTTLNNKTYLIVEILVTRKTKEKDLMDKLKRHNAICQGVKEINSGGFWNDSYGIFRVLVPEENIIEFNNDTK